MSSNLYKCGWVTVQEKDTRVIDNNALLEQKLSAVLHAASIPDAEKILPGDDGFEDGLIGAKKGETRNLNLTFPENYQEEDLAGQDVVFTVKINAIKTTPELTEEWVKENTEYDSVEKYKEGVRKDLEETNSETAKNTALSNAWTTVMDSSEVMKYPQEDVDKAMKLFDDNLK